MGIIVSEKNILDSIDLEIAGKYRRYILYSFLPARNEDGKKLDACILVGSFEVHKEMDKSFYNPFKLYINNDGLSKMHEHTLRTIALEAAAKAYLLFSKDLNAIADPRAQAFELINILYRSKQERDRLNFLAENYFSKMICIFP